MLRRALLGFVMLSSLAAPAFATGTEATSDMLRVTLDQAKVAKVPTGTSTLVIGNPAIADVTMLKGGVGMVVTGRGYGQTNLMAIDAEGNILDEKQVRVEPATTVLVVQRGNARASYSCSPKCMPTIQLGDDNTVFGDTIQQIGARNGMSEKGAGGPAK